MDNKDAWKHTWSTLLATCTQLETEIGKHADSPLLKGVLDNSSSSQPHTQVHRRVADARQQLVELQALVSSGAGQASTAFISALSDRISTFAQQLNAIKQQQRSDYALLLQDEQQLLEELAVLELTLTSTPQEQQQHLQGYEQQQEGPHAAPGVSRAWPCPAADTGSRLSQHACNTSTGTTSCRRSSDTAADCVCTSPDRPGRRTGGSPAKGSNTDDANSSSRVNTHTKGSSSSSGGVHAVANSSSSSGGGLLPEVEAYDAFLERHGATGGWHPEDHAAFMAILKAHRGDYNAALAAAVDALPLQTRASVIAHCRWHADLCELEMRKRIALVNWRAAKEAAKAAFRAQAVALGEAGCSGLGASLVLGSDPAPADQQDKEVRQLKQQLVQQWKEEQAAARAEAARAAQEQRQLQRQAEAQQRQQRREELRRQLQDAKAAKQAQQQQQEEAAVAVAAKQAPQLTPEQKQRLAQRNAAAVERQRALLAAKASKQEAKARAQAQLLAAAQGMAPQVDRDPSRLLSATSAAAARAAAAAAGMKEAAEQGGSRGRAAGGFVLHVAHKATPNWVAGVQGL